MSRRLPVRYVMFKWTAPEIFIPVKNTGDNLQREDQKALKKYIKNNWKELHQKFEKIFEEKL